MRIAGRCVITTRRMLYLHDIFGQDTAINQLRLAWKADRLPHGLIFSGPSGVGKGSAARAVAAWFLCENPGADDACGACRSCHLIGSDTHPDYHLIYRQLVRQIKKDSKARDLSIDVIEAHLLEPASRKSGTGRGKVFVIEEAETMTRDAANSMLKTLEEPQGRVLIILLTDQLHSLLPTIRSRCQMIPFTALPLELVMKKLIAGGADADAAKLATIISEGSLGLAMRWTQDGIVERTRQMQQRLDAILTGRPVDDLPSFIAESAGLYVERQEQRDPAISKDQVKREAIVLYLQLAADHIRRRLPQIATAGLQLRACRIIDDIAQSQIYVQGNVNVDLVMEHIGIRIR